MEQAKKRDHKIFITDTAIEKVSLVKPSDFSYSQASLMKSKHKELLNVAKKQNNSNEVLFIENLDFNNEVRISGNEFVVSPEKIRLLFLLSLTPKGNRLFTCIIIQVQILFLLVT